MTSNNIYLVYIYRHPVSIDIRVLHYVYDLLYHSVHRSKIINPPKRVMIGSLTRPFYLVVITLLGGFHQSMSHLHFSVLLYLRHSPDVLSTHLLFSRSITRATPPKKTALNILRWSRRDSNPRSTIISTCFIQQ